MEQDDYETYSQKMCDRVTTHVHQCKQCQRRLSFDPIEKALLKTHSVKNEIFELIAFMVLGIVIIILVHIAKTGKSLIQSPRLSL